MGKKLVELKPCPFCGEKPKRLLLADGNRHVVWCRNDKCKVRPVTHAFDRMCDATKAWNRRAKDGN